MILNSENPLFMPKPLNIVAWLLIIILFSHLLTECQRPKNIPAPPVNVDPDQLPYQLLSEYAFFTGNQADLQPNEHVLPYDLNTPLFSDYAYKARFVWMPDSVSASVNKRGEVEFPDNTVLIKTFYYPSDFRQPDHDWRIIETRLLIKTKGDWQAFTYVWDEQQKDAKLSLIGDFKPVSWTDEAGQKHDIEYLVPNKNQCKSCHNVNNKVLPIGPKVRNLDRPFAYADGELNQLQKWQNVGILQGEDLERFQPIARWNDPQSGTLEARALAYLDVNCGHCHSEQGPAHTSGLYLTAGQTDRGKLGFCKTPVAAGKGSGGRKFGIVPGQPDASILYYRMESNDPGVMMPEFGRVLPHKEGIELIRAWIASLEGACQEH